MKKRKPELPLLMFDVKNGALKRYVRADAPRYAGDDTRVKMTHDLNISSHVNELPEWRDELEQFRVNPEKFA